MRLAKPHLDIGLFTNDIDAQREFWSSTVGLRLDHELDMGPGWVQHRYDANGSVVKVNHRAAPLPVRTPSGFVGLAIASAVRGRGWSGAHPGGDAVELVPPGQRGIVGVGVTIAGAHPAGLCAFYCEVLGFERLGSDSARCGDSMVFFVAGPGGADADDFAGPGFRYLTIQVYDADGEMAEVVRKGGRIVRPAVNFAGVARYGFVADPDGNWVEISARTSLTGVAVT